MLSQNERSGWGGNPIRTGNFSSADTKRIELTTSDFKRNALPAAVFDEADPRGFSAARVVPSSARKISVGGATLGYLKTDRSSMDRSSWRYVVARQRFNELARLARYRLENDLDLGPPVAWALALANLAVCLGKQADVTAIAALCRRLQLPELDEDVAAAACHSASRELMKAAHAGALLQVTTVERDDCRLLRIDAWDEAAHDRQRRLARERQRRRRHVTLTRNKRKGARDMRRGTASPALRALRSSTSFRLASRQEPQPFPFFPGKEKGQAGTTAEATGVADAPQGPKLELAKTHSVRFAYSRGCAEFSAAPQFPATRQRSAIPREPGQPRHLQSNPANPGEQK